MQPRSPIERIFSRQEQSVVYLFSRHWEKLPCFKHKYITRIHTHFPDFYIDDGEAGTAEAIEFEYALSDFCSHLNRNDIEKLKGRNPLHIVYWEHDVDGKDIQHWLREIGVKAQFVCLKDYFRACVFKDKSEEPWEASWTFNSDRGRPKEAYPIDRIEKAAAALRVQHHFPAPHLYRVIGFNKSGSDFIEFDHWEQIHFFTTTTRFSEDRIPAKLLFKPVGSQYFNGYLDIRFAFKTETAGRSMKQFFREFYFYEYDHDVSHAPGKVTCFVCNAVGIDYEVGVSLFNALKVNYNFGVRGSPCITDEKHIALIDKFLQ